MRCWLLALLAACGPAIPPLPAQGGPPWLELTSEHFTLWTDTSAGRARELVSEMEHLRQVVIGASFRSVAREGRILVIALRDEEELHAYEPDPVAAVAFPPDSTVVHQPMILLAANNLRGDEALVETHELTHAISFAMIPNQPPWFAEGLATFFATIHLDEDHGTVDLGRPPEHRGQPLPMHHLIGLRTMFECKALSCLDAGFYATAWAVFTYLQNAHAVELSRFEQLLAANQDWQTAWNEAFPRLSPDTLEEELRGWLVSGSHTVLHFSVQLKDYPVTQRTLGEGEIHAIRGLLAPRAEEALAEVQAANRVDPTNVLANVLAVSHGRPITPGAARAIAGDHPDDWRAWWLVAVALGSGDEAEAARHKACELAAANPAIVTPANLCVVAPAGAQGHSP